jgi:hypothetical protein
VPVQVTTGLSRIVERIVAALAHPNMLARAPMLSVIVNLAEVCLFASET